MLLAALTLLRLLTELPPVAGLFVPTWLALLTDHQHGTVLTLLACLIALKPVMLLTALASLTFLTALASLALPIALAPLTLLTALAILTLLTVLTPLTALTVRCAVRTLSTPPDAAAASVTAANQRV